MELAIDRAAPGGIRVLYTPLAVVRFLSYRQLWGQAVQVVKDEVLQNWGATAVSGRSGCSYSAQAAERVLDISCGGGVFC